MQDGVGKADRQSVLVLRVRRPGPRIPSPQDRMMIDKEGHS
jgi:hypothetical protein